MNTMKVATWRLPVEQLVPPQLGAATMLDIDLSGHPEMVEHLADWTPVSHTVLLVEDHVVFSVLLTRVVEAPESPEGL